MTGTWGNEKVRVPPPQRCTHPVQREAFNLRHRGPGRAGDPFRCPSRWSRRRQVPQYAGDAASRCRGPERTGSWYSTQQPLFEAPRCTCPRLSGQGFLRRGRALSCARMLEPFAAPGLGGAAARRLPGNRHRCLQRPEEPAAARPMPTFLRTHLCPLNASYLVTKGR